MQGFPVIKASEELENLIYKSKLTGSEISALKKRSETYQQLEQNPWSKEVFRAYSQYFGFMTSLKVIAVLQELIEEKLFPAWTSPVEIYDLGAGTLGASLGAIDFLKGRDLEVARVHAIDHDLKPMQWAQREFQDFLPEVSLSSQWTPKEGPGPRLFLCVDVLNETEFKDSDAFVQNLRLALRSIQKNDLFIFIEPASKVINQRFLQWRDSLLNEKDRPYHLLLPCTHEKVCPAVAQGEWCHEERDYRAPQAYWTTVQKLNYERRSLVYSALVLGPVAAAFETYQARVVSRNLKSKGKTEKWLCADGRRWKVRLLKRHKTEQNQYLFESERGAIIDCRSTEIESAR